MIDGSVELNDRRQAEKRSEIQRAFGFEVAREDGDKVQFVLNREFVKRSSVFAHLKFIKPSKVGGQLGARSIINGAPVKLPHKDERIGE